MYKQSGEDGLLVLDILWLFIRELFERSGLSLLLMDIHGDSILPLYLVEKLQGDLLELLSVDLHALDHLVGLLYP